MRFIVYGAGAIGSVIGGYLYQAGFDTALLAREGHASRISDQGLLVRSPSKIHRVHVPAFHSPTDLLPFRDGDVVLLTVKTQHSVAALGEMRHVGMPISTPIFCMQNSASNERFAADSLENVYGGLVAMPALYLHDGEVAAADIGRAGVIEIGRFPQGTDPLTQKMVNSLQCAGFHASENPRIMESKFTKLVGNLGNAVMAIVGLDANPAELDQLKRDLRSEAFRVFERAAIPFEPEADLNQRVMTLVEECKLPEGTLYGGSTWQSLIRGTGTVETDYFNGEIVRIAVRIGIPAPLNLRVCQIMKRMIRDELSPGAFSIANIRDWSDESEPNPR